MAKTVYVFVRKDIPVEDQMVQVAHVCLLTGTVCAFNGFAEEMKETRVVLFEVQDLKELHKKHEELARKAVPVELFYEPSNAAGIELGYCALATRPIEQNIKGVLYGSQKEKDRNSSSGQVPDQTQRPERQDQAQKKKEIRMYPTHW